MKSHSDGKLPTVFSKILGNPGPWRHRPCAKVFALLAGLFVVGQTTHLPAQESAGNGAKAAAAPVLASGQDLDTYKAARTPQATVVLANAAAGHTAKSKPEPLPDTASATTPTAPSLTATGGALPGVLLAPPAAPAPAKGTAAGTSTSSTAAPPAASVTLQFDPVRAGQLVWVQTLDGGTVSALDADGATVYAQGGFDLEISSAGTVAFIYQAPAIGGHYQVVARLEDVPTVLSFDVPDINAAAAE